MIPFLSHYDIYIHHLRVEFEQRMFHLHRLRTTRDKDAVYIMCTCAVHRRNAWARHELQRLRKRLNRGSIKYIHVQLQRESVLAE